MMKKFILTSVVLGAAFGLAACTPAAEEAGDTAEPETIEIEDDADDNTDDDSKPGKLDQNGNPVDQ
ncbi:hypothetical protein [Qipengyuania sp. ASV99]|uniref:hypothetical protein n=1 Tax=Qipengyuania sp. ASV99 TaxID=3399681 RepID=UPI003A4C6A38